MKTKLSDSRWIYFDCDDTLVMWHQQNEEGFDERFISITHNGYRMALVPHQKNIEMLKDCYNRGYSVVVWSAGGLAWAQKVTKSLKLNKYVHFILSKPLEHVDDIRCCEFMGRNAYRQFKMEDVDVIPRKKRQSVRKKVEDLPTW